MKKRQTIRQLILFSMMSVLMAACTTSSTKMNKVAVAKKGTFSSFTRVKLTPTALPLTLDKMVSNRKAVAYFDRTLLIHLSKKLKKQKIVPTNDHTSRQMLNIVPRFEEVDKMLRLHVVFQDSQRHETVKTLVFTVPNTWQTGFYHSANDHVLLTQLAEQVVSYVVGSF